MGTIPSRPRPGSILEIKTPSGFGYFQAVVKDSEYGYLVRVFPGSWNSRPTTFSEFVKGSDFYFIFFPLEPAVRRGLVSVVGYEELPRGLDRRPPMRRAGGMAPGGRVLNWIIRDGERERLVEKLAPEEARLSLEAIWNDTLLADMIDKQWRPEMDQ